MIKSVIVEDDPNHSERLVNLLKRIDQPIEVLSICASVDEAMLAIDKHHPELIFLDIELQGGETGFDLLRKIENLDFDVIFTTFHLNTDNTIAAIRACALDFLPKPVIITELERAVKRFVENKKIGVEQVKTLKANLELKNLNDGSIWIADSGYYLRIEVKNIVYCESDNEATYFYLQTEIEKKKEYLSPKSIGEWERDLNHSDILRIHNEYLVNLKYIVSYIKGEGGSIKMKNGKTLPVSRKKKETLLRRLGIK